MVRMGNGSPARAIVPTVAAATRVLGSAGEGVAVLTAPSKIVDPWLHLLYALTRRNQLPPKRETNPERVTPQH